MTPKNHLSTNDLILLCGLRLARWPGSYFVQRVMNDNGEELYRGTMAQIKRWLRDTRRIA